MDAEKFASVFADNGSFKFGNGETVTGKDAVREYVAGLISSLNDLSHRIQAITTNGDSLMCRGEVTYTRKDSSKLPIPFANYFKLQNGLASEYQVYADISALY